MTFRRLFLGLLLALAAAVVVYTGVWHVFTVFASRMPMLSWMPIVAFVVVGAAVAAARRARAEAPASPVPEAGPVRTGRPRIDGRAGVLAALAVLTVGGMETLFFRSNALLEEFTNTTAPALPARTQPRLLPRAGVRDDPQFIDAKEIHLARDPQTGGLVWTGEWQASSFSGPSQGVAVKRLDEAVGSRVIPVGFEKSASGIGPGTPKWKAKLRHPFSKIQYPVIVPTGSDGALAVMPYLGYRGFPFRRPYLKGVIVYHQDGRLEDLTPAEAARRPELVRSGRIMPEALARKQAEALARSDDLDGKIVDGEGNRQPFLTALDPDRTVWLTIINGRGRTDGVKAVVLTNAASGATAVWRPPAGERLVSTQTVVNTARALPLRWKERRCCDSDGHSYTVTLREVVEPRLAFKDGRPYYMVSVVPTDELVLSREIEYTLLLDARTGARLEQFDHVHGGQAEDERLQEFFAEPAPAS